jgi:hypothetical protein
MNDAALLSMLKEQLRQCAGFEGDAISTDRKRALDYYFQRARGDEVTGRSQVVSGDVSAMVEANLAQMMDSFSSSNIVEFQAFGKEDEDQAQLESDTVSYVVMEMNNGYMALKEAIKDALLLRNGFVKVWFDERRYPKLEQYRNVTPEALAQLMNRPSVETSIKKYDPETREAKIRSVYVRQMLKVASVAPENLFYPKEYDSSDLQDIPFIAERHVDKRSDLIELGFSKSKVKDLKPFAQNTTGQNTARNVGGETENPASHDPAMDTIEWYEAYVLYDSDNDGIAERHRVAFSDETILDDVELSLVPYAGGSVILQPHRLTGISLWDKLSQTQDINTGLLRALMDNINAATKNRTASLDGAVNPDDLADGRVNGNIRVKKSVQDVRMAVMPFTIPDLSQGILANIQHQNSVRSEMGGAALDMASGNMQLNDRVGSEGLDRAYSVMEQLAADMTKNIAQTLIRAVFLLAHDTLRERVGQPFPIKSNGKWMEPIPAKWPKRYCVYVKPGMSPGERSRKAAALNQILQAQINLAQQGMQDVLVSPDGFYKALMDWARVSEIANPEQYFIDPMSPEAQQAAQFKAQAAQQAQQKQEALMTQAVQTEQLKPAVDKYKHDSELQFKYWEKTMDVEVEEAKIAGDATVKMLAAEGKPDGSEGTSEAAEE